MNMSHSHWTDKLHESLAFRRYGKHFATPQEAWEACDRADWMVEAYIHATSCDAEWTIPGVALAVATEAKNLIAAGSLKLDCAEALRFCDSPRGVMHVDNDELSGAATVLDAWAKNSVAESVEQQAVVLAVLSVSSAVKATASARANPENWGPSVAWHVLDAVRHAVAANFLAGPGGQVFRWQAEAVRSRLSCPLSD